MEAVCWISQRPASIFKIKYDIQREEEEETTQLYFTTANAYCLPAELSLVLRFNWLDIKKYQISITEHNMVLKHIYLDFHICS